MKAEYDFLQDLNNKLKEENKELRIDIEILRDMNRMLVNGLPQPCTFDGKRSTSEYTLSDWLSKLKEEVAEVEAEVDKLGNLSVKDIDKLMNEDKDDCLEPLVEELFDVITVATSKIDWLGWTLWGRCKKQKGVNEKNRCRGYWE